MYIFATHLLALMNRIIEFLPIITTILAVFFTRDIYQHWRQRRTKYLLWWTIGIVNFGLGTLLESINILFGWSEFLLKFWYISGALLAGYTLAQGTVYFLLSEKFGNWSVIFWLTYVTVAAVCVIICPIAIPENFTYKLSGEVFQWQWVRYFSPFINAYSFVFLFGGAIYSANKYFNRISREERFIGNIYISFGTLLPGVGGFYTKLGYVEVLFVTEMIGLFLIYRGYRIINRKED